MDVPIEKKAVNPPAKLNIRLKVLGKRPDGYHELDTIMVPVGIHDDLELKIVPFGIHFQCRGFIVPGPEKNLVARAAEKFFSAAGIDLGVEIDLIKNIPVAAGLGGGSSDAAWTLMALNEMFESPLLEEELSTIALELGADVPFFLKKRVCIAGGIGEILFPIKGWPDYWYVIVVPRISVSTAWVYGELKSPEIQESKSGDEGIRLTEKGPEHIMSALTQSPLNIVNFLENDLETITADHFPIIEEIKMALLAGGAKGALMSGSGPTVFGLFSDPEKAGRAVQAIGRYPGWNAFLTEILYQKNSVDR